MHRLFRFVRVATGVVEIVHRGTPWHCRYTHDYFRTQTHHIDVDATLKFWKNYLSELKATAGTRMQQEEDEKGRVLQATNQLRRLIDVAIRTQQSGGINPAFPKDSVQLVYDCWYTLDQPQERRAFLSVLTTYFGPDPPSISTAYELYSAAQAHAAASGDEAALDQIAEVRWQASAKKLHSACRPLWSHLLRPLSSLPRGIEMVMDMRAMALAAQRDGGAHRHAMKLLAVQLSESLSDWFSVGLLRTERITWAGSPGEMLEFVAGAEAVLQDKSIAGVKARCSAKGRRVYGLFHPLLPLRPLAVLNVALTRGPPESLQDILSHREAVSEEAADTAAFYSISSTQPGLAGIDIGNHLIKSAVTEIVTTLPSISKLVTLSPIPGFAGWLHSTLPSNSHPAKATLLDAITEADRTVLESVAGAPWEDALLKLIKNPKQYLQPAVCQPLQELLCKLCANYLLLQKRRSRALDPVANFHLRNGASVYRINFGADLSDAGLQRSFGMMVNYWYDVSNLDANNRRYTIDGHVAAHDQVVRMLQ